MAKRNSELTITYSAKDIIDKLEFLNTKIDESNKRKVKLLNEIKIEAKKTNGKVAENLKEIQYVKRKSLGVWISNNPFKTVGIVLGLLSLMIYESRNIILDTLFKLFF